LANFFKPVFIPHGSPEEERIKVLADLVISLMFPQKKNELILAMALPEVKEVYKVILKHGGGWSSNIEKSNPEKRKTVALDWYRRNRDNLSYLKEIFLEDPKLYEDGGGQEKRNFMVNLLIKIVKDQADKEITFQKVDAHLKNLKKSEKGLLLEDL
jgi:hypothetical protein